jgi:sterol desaturase/sphingolipid hydroxylase (fatty acid hydroxylase superfamily)
MATATKSRPAGDVFAKCLVSHIRAPLLGALFTQYIAAPCYFTIARWWKAQAQTHTDGFAAKLFSDQGFFTAGTMALHAIMYLCVAGFYHYCDRVGALERFKLHRVQRMGPSVELLHSTWIQAAVGQLVTGPPSLWLVGGLFAHFGSPAIDAPLPAVPALLGYLLFAQVVNCWGFYWSHRLLHHPSLYWIHKRHHAYTGTIGFAAEYAHPIEQILSNQGPTVLGCLLVGSHQLVWFVWLTSRLKETYEGHSGYCFKGSLLERVGLLSGSGSPYHDFHHSMNSGNFAGANGEYLDWFFGTQAAWAKLGGLEGYLALRKEGRPNGNALCRAGAKKVA